MRTRSLAGFFFGVLIFGSVAIPPLPAQTFGSAAIVHDVPFRSSGNAIELLLVNRSPQPTGLTSVAIAEQPTWLRFDADSRTYASMNHGEEGVALFTFSVDPDAPVGGVGHVRFTIAPERGDQRVTVIAVRVAAPESNVLEQNYPNPFNPSTSIGFLLADESAVELSIFDLIGRKVAVLAEGRYGPGRHHVAFDARTLPSGTYIYRLHTRDAHGSHLLQRQMILLK